MYDYCNVVKNSNILLEINSVAYNISIIGRLPSALP